MLFTQNPEHAHHATLKALACISKNPAAGAFLGNFFAAPELPVEVFGLRFPNPIGLAAGMDKFADAVPVWEKLGFGFCELGGVTRFPQPGNPTPRIFRVPAAEAIINRMGFNNAGAEAFAEKLISWEQQGRWPRHPVGVNLGKSKITPLENAAEDYAASFRLLREHVDFFVINVSSPNTPGLRQLQDKTALEEIFIAIQEAQLAPSPTRPRPALLVKVAPDLSFEALDEILELALTRNLSGIVATNTTLSRPPTEDAHLQKIYSETGGLSGKPLRERSTDVIRHIFKQTAGNLPIIGVGGIFNADDAWEKFTAGATLVQIYSGLIFEGPGLPANISKELSVRLKNEGVKSLKDIVGIAARH